MSENTQINQQEHKRILPEDGVTWVGSSTNTKSLASYIYGAATRDNMKEIRLRGIGAGAICQMSKAYIISRARLMEQGIKSSIDMYFKEVDSTRNNSTLGSKITAIEYHISFIN